MTQRVQRVKLGINRALETATGYRLVAAPKRHATAVDVRGGLVEEFSDRTIRGWVATDPGSDPVLVAVMVNGLEAVTTWVTDGSPGHGGDELRTFGFTVRDLWRYCRRRDRLSVRINNRPLPIVGHGMYRAPSRNGAENVAGLRSKLADGYVFTQTGALRLSRRLDTAWQKRVMDLYQAVGESLRETHGYDAFLVYGTLLGAVREGGFIGHDVDFDAAYVSRHTTGPAAAAELREIAFEMIDRGFDVEGQRSALHIHHADDHAARVDLFHLYFDDAGALQFPFGVAGTTEIAASDWHGTTEIELAGAPALIPVNAEQMVEHIYGPGWRSPKAGFDWGRDRTKRATPGILPVTFGEEVYWSNFYQRHEVGGGSPFFEAVSTRPDMPGVVLDIGCGDGRDALAFAAEERTVLGLDRSAVAVEHASKRAAELGLDGRVRFAACDVTDADAFKRHVATLTSSSDGPILFYLRFFLHSIREEAQEAVLAAIRDSARRGDMFAAEFRTDRDEQLAKAFGKHFRRYQNGPAFGAALSERFEFDVLEEVEGQGLSPYQDEDPYLYRVIARRR
jgi:SAM-dependent methyltransferase